MHAGDGATGMLKEHFSESIGLQAEGQRRPRHGCHQPCLTQQPEGKVQLVDAVEHSPAPHGEAL